MKHIPEIPSYDELTEDQKKTLLLNVAFLMNRIGYLLDQECKHSGKDYDTTEDAQAANDLSVADLVIGSIMRDHGGNEEDEETLDNYFDGAKNAFDWIMASDFAVAKAVPMESNGNETESK